MAKQSDYLMRGLLHAFYWFDESLQNHLRASGKPFLSRSQSMTMVNISDGITRPSDLARNLGISRQAVQQFLAEMEKQGLVHLAPDPDDARARIVRFSSRGRDIGEVAQKSIAAIERELKGRLGAELFSQLKQALLESDWGDVVQPTPATKPNRPLPSRRSSSR